MGPGGPLHKMIQPHPRLSSIHHILPYNIGKKCAQGIHNMDEDQDMDQFIVENEFENGMWIGDDFDAEKRQTKEEALFGVEDSDSEYEDSRKRRRRNEGSKMVDLSKPVNFFSAGVVLPLKEIDRTMKKDAKAGGSSGPAFEMFTKGIGSKLLEKMGYKGGGLGKNEQGIAKPIEAKLRPKNMGMGFNEFRENTTGLPPPPRMLALDEEVGVEKLKSEEKLWKNTNKGKKKAGLCCANDLVVEEEAQNGGLFEQTVLGRHGPQPKLLTNQEDLNAAIKDNTPMPKLHRNLQLIVDMTEADIHTCKQNESDKVRLLNKKKEWLETAASMEGKRLTVMEVVMSSIEHIRRQVAEEGMDLIHLALAFAKLKDSYQEEYKSYNVQSIALSLSLPLMLSFFKGWQPFLQPQHGIEAMVAWQKLLEGKEAVIRGVYNSPYRQLVLQVVFPHVHLATTNVWQPRDPEPILRFLEAWEKLLPENDVQKLLEGVVMPKLIVAVDAWDPRLEEEPIHAWLTPWLPWLGSRMETLYGPIRYKLRQHSMIPRPTCGVAQVQQLPKQHARLDYEDGCGEELSLKEAVEAFARDNDIEFVPKRGHTYEGLQVYNFGSIKVVVHSAKQRILAQTGDGWATVYLEQMLEMHRSRGAQ